MARPYKMTWFFEGTQQARIGSDVNVGWTETWYLEAESIDDALGKGLDQTTYTLPRRRILHNLYRISWVRASDPANPRLTKTAPVQNGAGAIVDIQSPAAQVTCALLVDFVVLPTGDGDITHHRRFLIRGLPSVMISGNVPTFNIWQPFQEGTSGTPTGGGSPGVLTLLNNSLNAFLNYVGRHASGTALPIAQPRILEMYVQTNNTVPQPISAPVLNPPGNTVTVTFTHPALARNAKVTVQHYVYPKGMNRVWTVLLDSAANAPVTLGTSRFNLAGDFQGTGTARVSNKTARPPDQYTVIGLRLKSTGRPFKLLRGRRRRAL